MNSQKDDVLTLLKTLIEKFQTKMPEDDIIKRVKK
jgi:hypothetical protein